MKRNSSCIGKFEGLEPESGKRIRSIQLEFSKPDIASSIISMKRTKVETKEIRHKKTLSNADLLQIPEKMKLVNNSTKPNKTPLDQKGSEKKLVKSTYLSIPPIEFHLPEAPDKKLSSIKEKFQTFKKTMKTVQKSVKKYKKNYKKVNKFIKKQQKSLFSKRIVMQVIFNAWKTQVKPKQNKNPPKKLLNKISIL